MDDLEIVTINPRFENFLSSFFFPKKDERGKIF